jgi:hypothetical protein
VNSDERTLDEGLDEIDHWSEQMVRDLEALSPDQRSQYFKRARAEFEQNRGRPLDLPIRPSSAKEHAS